jgi:hypothetical protein
LVPRIIPVSRGCIQTDGTQFSRGCQSSPVERKNRTISSSSRIVTRVFLTGPSAGDLVPFLGDAQIVHQPLMQVSFQRQDVRHMVLIHPALFIRLAGHCPLRAQNSATIAQHGGMRRALPVM